MTVSASTFILPHLADHEILYQVNGSRHETEGRTEYVVIDLRYAEFRDLEPLYLDAGYVVEYEIPGAAVLLRCPFYSESGSAAASAASAASESGSAATSD